MANQESGVHALCSEVCEAALAGRDIDLPLLARNSAELDVLKRARDRAHRFYQRRLDAGEQPALNAAAWEPEQQLLGKFTVVRKLGNGGMGEVYLVRRNRDGRELAAKRVRDPEDGGVLDPLTFLGGRRKQQAAMLEEIIQSMQLPESPYVLRCLFFDIIDGGLVLFTEYARNGSVADCLVRGSLYEDKAFRNRFNELAWQILSGLVHLHESQVVHQDIKPENVLITDLDYGLHARIADFGVARPLTQNQDLHTWEAPLAGFDRRYASPEQLAGHSVTATSDVYSWALTMLASAPKTEYRQALKLLKSNREQFIVDRLAFLAETQGTAVTSQLKSALAADPQARPSAHELLEALEPLTEEPRRMCELDFLLEPDTAVDSSVMSSLLEDSESAAEPGATLESSIPLCSEGSELAGYLDGGEDSLSAIRSETESRDPVTPREQLVALVSREILDRAIQDGDLGMDANAVEFLRSIHAEDEGQYQTHLLQVCDIKARMLAENGNIGAAIEVLSRAVQRPDYQQLPEKERYGLAQARLALLLYDHSKDRPNAWQNCLQRAQRLIGTRGDFGMRELVNQVEGIIH